VLLHDEEIGLVERRMRACHPVVSKRVGRVHKGMLSRVEGMLVV
jgi:hypothetical protein